MIAGLVNRHVRIPSLTVIGMESSQSVPTFVMPPQPKSLYNPYFFSRQLQPCGKIAKKKRWIRWGIC